MSLTVVAGSAQGRVVVVEKSCVELKDEGPVAREDYNVRNGSWICWAPCATRTALRDASESRKI